jgi:hypothetical protein
MTSGDANRSRYRIVVDGRIGEAFASITGAHTVEPGDGRTALVGEFRDQAELYGVLDRLRDLGIPLRSVDIGP